MNTQRKNVLIISIVMLVLMGPCFATIPNYLANNYELSLASLFQLFSFLITLGIALLITLLMIKKQKSNPKEIGLFSPTPWYAILIAILVGFFWAINTSFSLKEMDPNFNATALWLTFDPIRITLMIIGPIGAFVEDFITRGFVMNELKKSNTPTWLQLVISSLIFAIYHSVWMIPIMGVYFLYGFFGSLIFGFILGGLYLIGKRSLIPVMIAHGIAVFVGEPLLTYVLMKSFLM